MTTIPLIVEGLRSGVMAAIPRPPEALTAAQDLPESVRALWTEFVEVRLFEDPQFSQWGLVLWGAERAGDAHALEREVLEERAAYEEGDLVIGEFLGDSDRLLVRSERDADDYGATLVVLPIDPRSDWPRWVSLDAFLQEYVAHGGEKFWPH